MTTTKKTAGHTVKKEKKLNDLYSSCYSEDEAVNQLIYLTNKSRNGGSTTESNIRKQHRAGKLGSLLKRLDPTAFYVD
jgi:hypothetical protein